MNVTSSIPTLIIIFLVLSVIATFTVKPENFQKSRVYVFASLMASIAVVILGLNVLVGTSTLQFQREVTEAQFTKQAVDKLWVYPNQIFTEKTKVRPEFIASLYPNNVKLQNLVKKIKTKENLQSELEEQFISILLIQCWEDYLTIRKFDQTGDVVWAVNYLQWAQSTYLKDNFERLKYNFAPTTIKFAELLFEHAKSIPMPSKNADDYKKAAAEFLNDPKVIVLFKERLGG